MSKWKLIILLWQFNLYVLVYHCLGENIFSMKKKVVLIFIVKLLLCETYPFMMINVSCKALEFIDIIGYFLGILRFSKVVYKKFVLQWAWDQ